MFSFTAQFKAISQAYEVLADQKKRDLYDRGGEQAIKEGGIASEMHNPMDIFDMFFGGSGRSRSPTKGKDVIHQLKVSLEDLYNGSVRKLALQKNVICAACEGLCLLQFILAVKPNKLHVYTVSRN